MDFAVFKPWLTAMIVPPGIGIALLAVAGLLLVMRWKRSGICLGLVGLAVSWLSATSGFALWLNPVVLPQVSALPAAAVRASLLERRVQAIVVLGGGMEGFSPEYTDPQPNAQTLARLRYGLYLSRQSGLPVAFAGGVGWIGADSSMPEGQAVALWLAREGLPALTWVDDSSKDTAQNAQAIAPILRNAGIQRIALVTHAWHMPRAFKAFAPTGMEVLPTPMGFIESNDKPSVQWLPSSEGVRDNRRIWREAVGLMLGAH